MIYLEKGDRARAAGLFDEAIACYQQALTLQPDGAEVHHKLAEVYYAQRKFAEALACCHQALRHQPTFAEAYKTLGNILQAENKIDAAIRAYSKSIEINPNSGEALGNLGSMLYKQGRLEEAVATYQKAIAVAPQLAPIYWNLAKIFQQQGKLEEAVTYQQKALAIQPDLLGVSPSILQGNALVKAGKLDEAIEHYQRAIQQNSSDALAYFYLAGIQFDRSSFTEAIANYQTAIQLKPDFAEAYCNLAITLVQQGKAQLALNPDRFHQAIHYFLKALELNPSFTEANQGCFELLAGLWIGNLTVLQTAIDNYTEFCKKTGSILAAIASINSYLQAGASQIAQNQFLALAAQTERELSHFSKSEIEALYVHFLFDVPHLRDDLKANSALFKTIAKQYLETCILQKAVSVEPEITKPLIYQLATKKTSSLRIGFLSKHFSRHSVGWCSYDVIRELSQLTPHLYFYITGEMEPDDITHQFKQLSEKFYIPQSYAKGFANPQEILKQISADELDILVDLDSFTIPIHAEILHHQPAPCCVSWLGFEAPFISNNNYFLGDWHTHPQGRESYYQEKLIRLPASFVAVSGFKTQPTDRIALRKARRISLDQVVYLCVAPGRKFNVEMVRAQVQILKQVPDSILVYKGLGDLQVIYSTYRQEFAAQGVGFHRIKFLPRTQTEEEHRLIYLLADVLLDSYPYNGGTHTLEALWLNLPLVTRVGEQYLSRMSYSFLKNLGIEAGIAHSWEEYTEWGIRLGKEVAFRTAIREQLVESKQPGNLAALWNPKQLAEEMYDIFAKLLGREPAISSFAVRDLLI